MCLVLRETGQYSWYVFCTARNRIIQLVCVLYCEKQDNTAGMCFFTARNRIIQLVCILYCEKQDRQLVCVFYCEKQDNTAGMCFVLRETG